MIQKVTLTKVFRSDKDKQGKPLMSKAGKPYSKCAIKTLEHGDKWLSGFGGAWNQNWQEGDEVQIDVEQKGEYLNFSKVDEIANSLARIKAIEDYLRNVVKPILDKNFTSDGKPVPTFNQISPVKVNTPVTQGVPTQNIPDDEIDPEEIPF